MNEEIKDRLLKLPDDIKIEELKIMALQRKIEDIKNLRKQIEIDETREVHAETYETTIKDEKVTKPTFTNEKARETEVNLRLFKHKEYLVFVNEEMEKQKDQAEAKIELNHLINEFRSLRYLITLMEVEK